MTIASFLSKAQKLPTLYYLLPLAYVSLPTTLHKIAFFCSEWRESGQCGASALALTTSPITLALENCSIRKPIQLVVGSNCRILCYEICALASEMKIKQEDQKAFSP